MTDGREEMVINAKRLAATKRASAFRRNNKHNARALRHPLRGRAEQGVKLNKLTNLADDMPSPSALRASV
jgi:hypothetical protein